MNLSCSFCIAAAISMAAVSTQAGSPLPPQSQLDSGIKTESHPSDRFRLRHHRRALTVEDGETLEINETLHLDRLSVGEQAAITAPEGYSITLTVDGVQTDIDEGCYNGDIALTVTEAIVITYGELDPHYFRTAIYIEDGAYVAEKSVTAAVDGGWTNNQISADVRITSNGEKFNGIMVTSSEGNTDTFDYTINHPLIEFNGNGGNDFAGFGAAIMSSGYANVTVDNAWIRTQGAVRTAVFAGGNSTMSVNNSYIEVNNGTLPDDYEFTVEMGKMMEVPWMLGITGNVRATNLVKNATAYYINSHIKAQAWGVLSTDDTDSVRLFCRDSIIETEQSGYGAYSIGDSIDTFSGCELNVTDYGLIMAAQGSGTFTDGTVVNSDRMGVMLHSGGSGTLTIDNGSVFNTVDTVIQAKGSFPTIVVDSAELNTENGIIVQLMANDDPFFLSMGDAPGGEPPPEAPPSDDDTATATQATFKNMTMAGDLINGNTSAGALDVHLENTTLKGAITTATTLFQYQIDGYEPEDLTAEDYEYIGQVQNIYESTNEVYGVSVSLDADSAWFVSTTSYLTSLTLAEGATLDAPPGATITMTVDGVETNIASGSYTGTIVLVITQD